MENRPIVQTLRNMQVNDVEKFPLRQLASIRIVVVVAISVIHINVPRGMFVSALLFLAYYRQGRYPNKPLVSCSLPISITDGDSGFQALNFSSLWLACLCCQQVRVYQRTCVNQFVARLGISSTSIVENYILQKTHSNFVQRMLYCYWHVVTIHNSLLLS